MRKYILLGIGLLTIVLLVSINLSVGREINKGDIKLNSIMNTAMADDSEGLGGNGEGGFDTETVTYIANADRSIVIVKDDERVAAMCILSPTICTYAYGASVGIPSIGTIVGMKSIE
jgi:hypothetical protein